MGSRYKIFIYILCITILGAWLRMHAISPYKFYADSYAPLVVAENIRTFGSAIGTLGPQGMLYPDFVSWTRPLYPLLILLFNYIFHNLELAAQAISVGAGILSIPLAYLYVKAALHSRVSGFFGALLLALSYNHAVWGGFILSETTGILFLLLTLYIIFNNREREPSVADYKDLLSGAVFALAVLCRYEYIVLVIPLIYFARSPIKILNMAAGGSLVLALAYFFLNPFALPGSASGQVGSLIDTLQFDIAGVRGFLLSDSLLALAGAVGFFLMLRVKAHYRTAIFSLLSILLLGIVYYQVNPAMQRYASHLLPFLLPPAAFALTCLAAWWQREGRLRQFAGGLALISVLSWQTFFAYRGLHAADEGIWFRQGYEEVAAKTLENELAAIDPGGEATLLASFPEPYYLYTERSVQSVAPEPPFVFISDSYDYGTILIVEDEGMRRIFPKFSDFLKSPFFEGELVAEIPFSSTYRFGTEIELSNEPLRIYQTRLIDLKQAIKQYDEINSSNPLLQ